MSRSSESKLPKGLEKAVGKKALREVPIVLLHVDPSYQRPLVRKHKKIAANFDPDAFGVPLVAQRSDGSLWIVDGQQRIEALKVRGKDRVRVDVFVSDGPEHEAHVFRLVNVDRTKLRGEELYNAALTEGEETAVAVGRLMKEYGFRVINGMNTVTTSDDVKSNAIRSVQSLLHVHRSQGEDASRFVLSTLRDNWPGDPMRTRKELILGLGAFYKNLEGNVDQDRLNARLSSVTAGKLIYAAALGVGSRSQNVAEAILKVYRRRSSPRS